MLELVVQRPGDLADDFVFVGGCAVGLLLTEERAELIRPT